MIKNIIFDIGGVLIDFEPARVLRRMGFSEETVEKIVNDVVMGPLWKELDRGTIAKEEIFEKMIQSIPSEFEDSARKFLYEEINNTVTSRDYARDWIKSLKDKNYGIYLLTNYPEWLFNFHFDNKIFTFTDLIDGKIVSGTVKKIKPDPAIYECLLNEYSLKAEECVFIDDRKENTEAAEKLGFKTVHFKEIDQVKEELHRLLSAGRD